jgi:hypothetical protein
MINILMTVRRTQRPTLGGYVASDGAWHRKGQIVSIKATHLPHGSTVSLRTGGCGGMVTYRVTERIECDIKYLGKFYASGRVVPAQRTIITHKVFYRQSDGKLIRESGWMPVVPR